MKIPESQKLKDLIKKLSTDPKIKAAVEELKTKANVDNAYYSKSFMDLMVYILKLSGGFLGKRKAKVVVEVVEALAFIISVSLILKRNLFDRPEVRAYFLERWTGLKLQIEKALALSERYVNQVLKKTKKN